LFSTSARPSPKAEPHKIKTVRLLSFPTLQERKKYLSDARFNVFHLTPQQLTFDMMSVGTSAMSQEQLAGQLLGDEAYAGSRNFENLQTAVQDVLGHGFVCPTHNALGAIKLIVTTMVNISDGKSIILSNGRDRMDVLTPREVTVVDCRDRNEPVFTGNIDLKGLEASLQERRESIALLDVQAFADGQHPISLENLENVRQLADHYGVRLVLDGSRIVESAWYVQRHELGQADRSIASIVRQMVKTSHVCYVDGAQDPKANTGGLISTDNPSLYESFMNEVVVFEGLHTYGGMSGRTLEVLARGIREMCDEEEVHWVMHQTERFTQRLREAGVPLERGCDGAYVRAKDVFPRGPASTAQDTFSAALYFLSGVRAVSTHRRGSEEGLVPIQIPRLAMMNEQLDQVADAVVMLCEQANQVNPLHTVSEGPWQDQKSYHWVFPDLKPFQFDTFPYQIHTIERTGTLHKSQREEAIRSAGYNTFLLSSADVSIDLLTDSGTSAMSTDQWAAYDAARATGAASQEYRRLVALLQDAFGYEFCIPTHQGRAAEHILSEIMIRPGQFVPGNMYFTTTKLHQEMAGGIFKDVIVDEAHDPTSNFPWKGNIDLSKLTALVDEYGADNIAYISFEHSVNMAGGQPVSMDNMKAVYAKCGDWGIPVFFDSTRCVENAFMIKQKDEKYHNTPCRDILREMMLYGDGCTVSGKKDFLINIGGVLCFSRENETLARKAEGLLRIYEGNVSDGGLSIADLAAMARGVEEMLNDDYIRSRVRQTELLGQLLLEGGIPIVTPPGSHAIFLDAKRFLPHIDQDEYPSQRLAAAIYAETGVRAMERGNVSSGRDPKTGKNYRPALELVRLTLPRRVYTNDHMKVIAEGITRVWEHRDELRGLRCVYEPKKLRFFQGRFEALPSKE
jgi:tyrosine phenol-lyase